MKCASVTPKRASRASIHESPELRQLNYNHLQCFWLVAREGSIVKASNLLRVAPQTISGQLKRLDDAVGAPLFDRIGRRLELTETGTVVFQYADEIFAIGSELASVVRGQLPGGRKSLHVGVVSSMPKLIAERIIAPALTAEEPLRLRCQEDSLERLLGALAVHQLDLVLSDQPVPSGLSLRLYYHRLGESGMSFFAGRDTVEQYATNFPSSLTAAPLLLPAVNSALRRRLDEWFETEAIVPQIAGEFDDSALMKAFGEAGAGLFCAPTVIESEVSAMYQVDVIGRTDAVTEKFYAISPERRLKHPAVVMIMKTARAKLFVDQEED